MERTKIFYFIPNLQQGGPERQILELLRYLPERFDPTLCVYHNNVFFADRLPPGQPKFDLGQSKMNLRGLAKLTEILRREQPQIFHSYRDKANFWGRIAAQRAGVPIIISACRNRMMELRYLLVERLLSARSDAVLTNSIGVKQELTTLAQVEEEKIRVIYNLLDIEHFRPPTRDQRQAARARFDLSDAQIALVLPGRLGLQKHQIGLLMALNGLSRRGELPANVVLLLAGRARDQWFSQRIKQAALAPALRQHVRILGAEKDMLSVYWASDCVVMPSLYEGLSNAALEGCACGLPAILSHAANVDAIVVNGQTGYEVETANRPALEHALDTFFQLSDEQRREMGRRAREHVAARFAPSPTHVIDQMVAVYDQLLSRR